MWCDILWRTLPLTEPEPEGVKAPVKNLRQKVSTKLATKLDLELAQKLRIPLSFNY